MAILITGAAGFIGSNLTAYHLKKGDVVYGVDNLLTGKLENIAPFRDSPHFHFFEADLTQWTALKEVLESVDKVYHLAAVVGIFYVLNDPLNTLDINIKTTQVLLETLTKVSNPPKLLITSSSEVYGAQTALLSEDQTLKLESTTKSHASYCISKMTNEAMVTAYQAQHQIPCVITRLFNTIGHNQSTQYGMVVPRFIQQAILNQPITVFGDGEQSRSFCDVRDTVEMLDLLISNPASTGNLYNVGQAQSLSMLQLASLIRKLANSESEITFTPFNDIYHDGYMVIRSRQPDMSRFQQLNPYQYQWSLEQTLKDLIDTARGRAGPTHENKLALS